ncbi:ABC transporter ATP-binding protein [Amphibacillus sp. Q70]|uniref:ABC transporter ATP-binding protein n=1 Tax=Amphibacillus sp. Q70 TaxID=3453416 RepID=UPI003F831614
MSTLIEVNHLAKFFVTRKSNKVKAIKDISIEINNHEFISIIGPSGCGKSTLLKMISGLLPYDEGEIIFQNSKIKDQLGFVFQDSVLLPWKTVWDNVIFPLEIKKIKTEENLKRVETLLDKVGLTEFKNSLTKELSGGMKQRASIVRSLSYNPSLLLMDEPFGALDAITRDNLNLELLRIWNETKKTIIFVTHDIEEAVFLSEKVIVLSQRPSIVKEVIDIDLPAERELSLKEEPEFSSYVSRLRGLLNEKD